MRVGAFALVGVWLVACGGQLLGGPNDAGNESVSSGDAGKDATNDAPLQQDVLAFDASADVGPSTKTCGVSHGALLAYYPLDGDTLDHSGHHYDATGASLTSITGLVGGAMHFDGSSSRLQVTSGSAMLQGPRTLCSWSRSNPSAGAGEPLFWGGVATQGDFYALFSNAPSNMTCTKSVPGTPFVDHWGTDCLVGALPPVMMGQWTLVCYAFDGASVVMHVNGSEDKVLGSLYDYPLTTLFVGSTLGNGTTTKGSFDGDIDEVSVWSTRLQPAEMMALWNGGAGCPL